MFTLLQKQIKLLRKWVNYHYIPFLTCKSFWWCEQSLRIFVPESHLGLEGLTCNLCFHLFLFPESLLTPRLVPGRPFTGCIRHFVIDGRPVSFSKAALVSGAVSINSCPAAWHGRARLPRTKFFRALKEMQSQPGGTAIFPPSGSLHLVEQDLNVNRQGMDVYYLSFGFLPWIQNVCSEQQSKECHTYLHCIISCWWNYCSCF